MKRALQLTASIVVLVAGTAYACLHAPASYKGSVSETSQQALIFWREGREELILKVDYRLAAQASLPDDLAWVVPVPAVPDDYAVVSPQIFKEAFELAEAHRQPERGRKFEALGPGEASKVIELARVTVGEYEITPLKATGPDAAAALNRWLSEHGYGEVPQANMQYYTERSWTFLAIKINKEKGAEAMTKEGGFRPLRVSFAADRIYYPLKFSSHQGMFNVTAYVFTEQPVRLTERLDERGFTQLPMIGDGLISSDALRWNSTYWQKMPFAEEAKKRLAMIEKQDAAAETELYRLVQAMGKGKLGKYSKLHLAKFSGEKVNGDGNRLVDWKKDFELEVSKEQAADDKPAEHLPKKLMFNTGGLEATYSVVWDGKALQYTQRGVAPFADTSKSKTVTPTEAQWKKFWLSVDEAKAWKWSDRYENSKILDGGYWTLRLEHGDNKLDSSGRNAFPSDEDLTKPSRPGMSHSFDQFRKALDALLGFPFATGPAEKPRPGD
jgi:hypothetical protein